MAKKEFESVLLFRYGELLLRRSDPYCSLPDYDSIEELIGNESEIHVLNVNNFSYAVLELAAEIIPPDEFIFQNLRHLNGLLDEDAVGLANRARQIVEWQKTNKFCGVCGSKVFQSEKECLAKECLHCGQLYFPKICPAVIVLVERQEKILLARSPHFPAGMFSAPAGFVEPGESLEQSARREIFEELGIEIDNLRYFGSQPWSFPNSLMIGFTADYAGGEIKIEPEEIESADWFTAADLPVVPPVISIARQMIDDFVRKYGGDPQKLVTSE